jgi:hypothetical protein
MCLHGCLAHKFKVALTDWAVNMLIITPTLRKKEPK